MSSRLFLVALLCGCLLPISVVQGEHDWPSWRGADNTGGTEIGDYPTDIRPESATWAAPLPGKGCSTPIVLNDVIYVTAPIAGRDALLAFDHSGKQLWNAEFGSETAGKHRNGSGCNASPTTDGNAVYVYFKSGTLAAVELDGAIRWQTNLVERFGEVTLFWDHGTSPVLTSKHVIMARMHQGESWIAAFDKENGEIDWKVARNYETKIENDHGYTSPIVIDHKGRESILLWGAEHLTIHDAASGELKWSCSGFNPKQNKLWPAIAMPVLVNNVAVIAYGRNDRKVPLLYGVNLSKNGDGSDDAIFWKRNDVGTFVPSPVAYQGFVYLVRDRGEVECLDPLNGITVWRGAFPKDKDNFYSSPLIAAGKLYAAREDGTVFVADIKNGFKLLSEASMDEPVIGSPVPSDNRIFIRGEEHLFCFSK